MKRIALFCLLLAAPFLGSRAQQNLRAAIDQLARQTKYISGLTAQSSSAAATPEQYYSVYTFAFDLPRKEGQRQVSQWIDAYNVDNSDPAVNMRALRLGKNDTQAAEHFSLPYGDNRREFVVGRDFDHLILLRAPSSRVEGQRVVTAIEWSERNKRIVGRAYVVEGQQRPNATGYFWKDLAAGVEGVLGELDLEMIDVDSAMTEMGPALEQIKKMGPQFEQMGKTLREKLSTLPQQLKGNKGKFSVKYIRDGQPSSTTTTIVHKGEKDTIIVIDPSDESSFFVDPSTVDETTIEAKNGYFLRFPFFADRFTGENNAYNQRLLNQFIDQGTPLLPYMDAGQLSATLQMCGKLMKKLTSKPGTTKMIARLTDYIQRCSDQLAEGRFTYHDSDADTPSAGT